MKYLKKSLDGKVPYYSKMITDGIILNANESAFETPKEIIDILKEKLDTIDLRRYPDTDNTIIREALAKNYNIDVTNITCGVGSDQLLDCIFRSLIEDEYIIACNPTFSMYKEYASYTNGKFIDIDFLPGFIYDTKTIIKTIKEKNPKLVIICSPNNPTGSYMEREDLETIIKTTNGVVLLDEAYSEFYKSNYDLAIKYSNVIVLKTFSKAYALAGIRLGYAISSSDLIDTINICKPPYNLSTLSQLIASIAIENKDLYKENIEKIVKLKDELYDSLKALNLNVNKSYSNFVFVKLNDRIFFHLLENKIYIRRLKYNDEFYYRINTGTKEENEILIEKIKEAL
ncbi:MAG: histidinol-phosphate transaminase [Acholeplasmatales bacterium]|nr:histidinol-phosphate transaminase [Acholeplasmatales bacterium]